MGLYARYVLPRLIDAACGREPMAELRAKWVPRAAGRVLEIGFGTGLNLPHYAVGDAAPTALTALEPAREFVALARRRLDESPLPVQVVHASAERIPAEDAAFDAVVSTWTLCSVPNVYRALAEMRRVLKPNGKLLFVEHGASPERAVYAWQRRVEPAWKRIGGGCHLTRRTDALLEAAGFRVRELKSGYLPGPKISAFTYRGVASRR